MYECLYKRVTNTENTTVIMKGEKLFLHANIFVPKTVMTGKVNKSQFEMYLHKTHFCILMFSLEWSHSHESLQFIANEQKNADMTAHLWFKKEGHPYLSWSILYELLMKMSNFNSLMSRRHSAGL